MLTSEFNEVYGTFGLVWDNVHYVDVEEDYARCYGVDGSILSEFSFTLFNGTYVKHGEYKYYSYATIIRHFKHNILHREDGPAQIEIDPNGTRREWWIKDGDYHRDDDEPAFILYNYDGLIKIEKWIHHGKCHRDLGPAYIYRRTDGSVYNIQYMINGQNHRDGNPAVIYYHMNGTISNERWYKNGKLHREDGPASIYYKDSGELWQVRWYINGVLVDTPEDVLEDASPEDDTSEDVSFMLEAPDRWEDVLLEKEQQNTGDSEPEWD